MVVHIYEHMLYIHVSEVHAERARMGPANKGDKQQSLSPLNGGYHLIRNSVAQPILIAAFVRIKH